jgi:hypothetical protein
MKVFKIKSDERGFFYKVLLVLDSMLQLKPSARKVLAEILYWNHKYRVLSEEDREGLLLSYESKKKMMEHLDMTQYNFHNQVSYLKKKGILTKDNKLSEPYKIDINDFNEILFVIETEDENG